MFCQISQALDVGNSNLIHAFFFFSVVILFSILFQYEWFENTSRAEEENRIFRESSLNSIERKCLWRRAKLKQFRNLPRIPSPTIFVKLPSFKDKVSLKANKKIINFSLTWTVLSVPWSKFSLESFQARRVVIKLSVNQPIKLTSHHCSPLNTTINSAFASKVWK